MIFESGEVHGVEIFIVRGGIQTSGSDEYFAYVQCANGNPGQPIVLKIKMDGYDFTIPPVRNVRAGCPAGEFHGTVSFDSISGSFSDGVMINLPRKDSVWE